jgi:cation diffusion facilitator CzcD-associated flavoprotein CzcO
MSTTNEKPTVLIVGAGLGGLMLGALLEKSGVPYNIFERAASVKPLGMSMVDTKRPPQQ